MATATTAMTLLDLLAGADDHPALIAPEKPSLTYAQMRANVVALAAQLNEMGLGQGDRIAIAMGNGPEMVLAYIGTTLCGTAAPLNPNYKQDEFAFYFEDTNAKALITLPGTLPAAHAAASGDMTIIEALPQPDGTLTFKAVKNARPARPVALAGPDDIAMILHTSGTTSRPKRVPIRHRNLAASAHNIAATYALSERGSLALRDAPLPHPRARRLDARHLHLGRHGDLPGGRLQRAGVLEDRRRIQADVVLRRADDAPDAARPRRPEYGDHQGQPLPLHPLRQFVARADRHGADGGGLRRARAGELRHDRGDAPDDLQPAAAEAAQGGHRRLRLRRGCRRSWTTTAICCRRAALGEVVVKGPNVIDGYENNPEANATAFVNGWFRTGDQGQIDADGYLSLTGRLKELINRGGEKISPLEIDDVLLRHAAVAEAVAFAVPHATLGEEVHAAVVLKGEATERELRAYCAERLAEYKVPRRFHMLEAIPRGATGKLQRINMAKLLDLTSDQ